MADLNRARSALQHIVDAHYSSADDGDLLTDKNGATCVLCSDLWHGTWERLLPFPCPTRIEALEALEALDG